MSDKDSKVNAELDSVMSGLLKEVKDNAKQVKNGTVAVEMSLTDKMKIIDRVLKWEAIKSKLNDAEYGKGFDTD